MKPIGVARFKAQLARFLRAVRKGEEIVVTDRRAPIARVVPFRDQKSGLEIRKALNPLGLAKLRFPPSKLSSSPSRSFLLEGRRSAR